MSTQNVTRAESVTWNHYVNGSVEDALKTTYDLVQLHSSKLRHWYWSNIRAKKARSITTRFVSYLFGAVGVLAPLTAAMQPAKEQLLWTQWGVLALAIAGLAQACDRVFGWSSGWQRYVTTVTTMEQLTTQFELDWAKCLLGARSPLQLADVTEPLELARAFSLELEHLRGKETDAWVAEFKAGQTALSELTARKGDTPATVAPPTVTATATVRPPGAAPGSSPPPSAVVVAVSGGTQSP